MAYIQVPSQKTQMLDIIKAKISVGNFSFELEGSESFVKGELKWFKESVLEKIDLEQYLVRSKVEAEMQVPIGQAQARTPAEKPAVKVFMKEKSPATNLERAAVIGYFLDKWEDIHEIDGKQLGPWYTKAGKKPPKYPQQTLVDAKAKKQFFDKGKAKGKYKLSETGRYLVEHELPRKKP